MRLLSFSANQKEEALMANGNPEAGWYKDPSGASGKLRYWNGTQWTQNTPNQQPPQQVISTQAYPMSEQARPTSKIIGLTDTVVSLGQADGSLRQVRREDCAFNPSIGDAVEVYSDETSVRVIKVEPVLPVPQAGVAQAGEGIHINISNEHTQSAQVPAQPAYYQTGKVVSKVTYILLAIFLGWIGVHKFYAGKTGAGVLYIVFCWTFIPALIGIIEGLVAIAKPADTNGNIVI
jgi:TM2 domain-containing membrane protein YozV